MKDLLLYIVHNITGSTEAVVNEKEEGTKVELIIDAPQDQIGMIIGKGGSMIKAIRNIVKIKATIEQKMVFVNIAEKEKVAVEQ